MIRSSTNIENKKRKEEIIRIRSILCQLRCPFHPEVALKLQKPSMTSSKSIHHARKVTQNKRVNSKS